MNGLEDPKGRPPVGKAPPRTPKSSADQDAPWPARRVRQALIAEVFGTFLLTSVSAAALLLAHQGLLPEVTAFTLAPALVVIAMIYTLGDVSGAHINPVVTLAFALRGAFPWRLVGPYWAAQFAGSVTAALLSVTFGHLPPATERVSPVGAGLLDAGCTAVLLAVVLATAHRNAKLSSTAGLAVGLTVALGHFVSNPVSGVAMNPAKVFGPALVSGKLTEAWPHLLGPVIGVVAGLLLTRAMRGPLNESEADAAQGTGGED
ncbi:MIP/aquaporin family protein [Deinococcus hopiensis]|uniref:Aquaporin NIP n=1 Tax=Deinococcus hopiensis KR-140 TaxID=695939 RepID=A0A1W1VI53_9DEIO|nr:MIP/aquaporin family protein [Deinococcus hopiensis]SMB92953.1 aquaporin NIP [Deinococcus hopiensis KR-140]